MGELEPKKTKANVNMTLCALPTSPSSVPEDNFSPTFWKNKFRYLFLFSPPHDSVAPL